MATILPFTPAPHARTTPNGERPAAIIFFPGVRYERGQETETAIESKSPKSPNGDAPVRSKH